MDPELSGFALGLLFGAAKVMTLGTIGFGVAWWRARRRAQELEQQLRLPSLEAERLDRLEQSLEYMASQLDRLVDGQAAVARHLTAAPPPPPRLPDVVTPH